MTIRQFGAKKLCNTLQKAIHYARGMKGSHCSYRRKYFIRGIKKFSTSVQRDDPV
jgi:predicted RNA binding protein YcfA (HicA-like mRNA interferase family)